MFEVRVWRSTCRLIDISLILPFGRDWFWRETRRDDSAPWNKDHIWVSIFDLMTNIVDVLTTSCPFFSTGKTRWHIFPTRWVNCFRRRASVKVVNFSISVKAWKLAKPVVFTNRRKIFFASSACGSIGRAIDVTTLIDCTRSNCKTTEEILRFSVIQHFDCSAK